jgi:HlyD family secretion protein
VDAYPRSRSRKVSDIRNAPQTVQNVVTYDVVIRVANPELKLKPGMTANVSIVVAHQENVLRIPNAVLRFRPEGWCDHSEKAKKETLSAGVERREATEPASVAQRKKMSETAGLHGKPEGPEGSDADASKASPSPSRSRWESRRSFSQVVSGDLKEGRINRTDVAE